MPVRVLRENCSETVILGVDEAGRGPMIGPMVVAAAAAPPRVAERLTLFGVRDSKTLTPRSRERLRSLLLSLLSFAAVRVVEPAEIDAAVYGETHVNLNYLEASVAAELVEEALKTCRVEKVFVDSPDPVAERFGEHLSRLLEGRVPIVAENDADKKYPIVSAASIIAKTERDRLVEELKKRYGDFGSGYPSDQRTRAWARRWLSEHGEPPPIARKSWKSWSRL